MIKSNEIRVEFCWENLFRRNRANLAQICASLPFRENFRHGSGRKRGLVGRRRREWKSIREVSSEEPVSQGRSRCRVWKALRRRLFILFGPLFRVKRVEGGAGGKGEVKERGARVNFHSGLMGLNALAINRTNPLHPSDVSIRLHGYFLASTPLLIPSSLSSAAILICSLSINPVKLFPRVAANLKRSSKVSKVAG